MLRASLLLLLVAACSAFTPLGSRVPAPRLDGRIVGGEPVDISQYPWQLSIHKYGHHICGASVISSTWTLTAAHCIDSAIAKELSIRAGTSVRESGGSVHYAADVLFHGDYDAISSDYDIGVIQISGSFSFGINVQAVNLATTEPAVGTKVTTTGWGTLTPGGSSPDELQGVTTTIVSRAICDERYKPLGWSVTVRMICASEEEGGKDACQGDSGGPLVAGNTQYGVVSWGEGCGSDIYPGVYSNVADLRDWIKERTGV